MIVIILMSTMMIIELMTDWSLMVKLQSQQLYVVWRMECCGIHHADTLGMDSD